MVLPRTRTWETDNHVFAKLPIQGAIYCLWDKPGHPTNTNLWNDKKIVKTFKKNEQIKTTIKDMIVSFAAFYSGAAECFSRI